MNGEVYQIASIVSAAKKALKENRDIIYSPQKYVQDVLFRFVSVHGEEHYIAKNVSEWFEQLKQRKIEDIKLLLPYEVKDRSRLGFSNQSGSMILCFYQDGQVTFFRPYWEFSDKARMWTIYYTENVWENPPANKPNFQNNENELKEYMLAVDEVSELALIWDGKYPSVDTQYKEEIVELLVQLGTVKRRKDNKIMLQS